MSTCAAQCSEPLGELVERGGYQICESCAQFWDSWEDLCSRPLSPDELLRHVRDVNETGDAIAAELKRAGISYPFQAQASSGPCMKCGREQSPCPYCWAEVAPEPFGGPRRTRPKDPEPHREDEEEEEDHEH